MKLDKPTWEEFAVSSIFEIRNGRGITAEEIAENPGTLKAVQSGEENNGVMGSISAGYCAEMNYVYSESMCLTVARTGTAGFVSFQPDGCVAGDSAKLLIPKCKEPTVAVLLFLQVVLQQLRFKYSYGRKVTELKYSNEAIDLPIQGNADGAPVVDGTHQFHPEGYVPDWQFMENYIRSLSHKPLTTSNKVSKDHASQIKTSEWNWFKLGGPDGLFDIRKGKRLTSADQTEGETPYIGAIESDNGVSNRIGQTAIHEGNTISLSYNGSVGEAFYQPDPFWSTDDVNALYLKPGYGVLNPMTGLFICTILRQEKYRFSYGRKWTLDNMNTTSIKLPVTPEGEPDWQFMEDYMRSLPYGDRIPEVGEC